MKVVVIRKNPFECVTLEDVTHIQTTTVGSVPMISISYGHDQTALYNPTLYIIQLLLV